MVRAPFISKFEHHLKRFNSVRVCDHISALPTAPTMNTNEARCPGCHKIFTFNGLCSHISRTQRTCCRAVHAALQTPTAFQPQLQPLTIASNPETGTLPDPVGDAIGLDGNSSDLPDVDGNAYDSPPDTDDGQISLRFFRPLINCKHFRWHWCA